MGFSPIIAWFAVLCIRIPQRDFAGSSSYFAERVQTWNSYTLDDIPLGEIATGSGKISLRKSLLKREMRVAKKGTFGVAKWLGLTPKKAFASLSLFRFPWSRSNFPASLSVFPFSLSSPFLAFSLLVTLITFGHRRSWSWKWGAPGRSGAIPSKIGGTPEWMFSSKFDTNTGSEYSRRWGLIKNCYMCNNHY